MPDDLYFKANGVKTSKIYHIKRYAENVYLKLDHFLILVNSPKQPLYARNKKFIKIPLKGLQSVDDTNKVMKIMRNTLDTAFELNKLIKYSMVSKSWEKKSNTLKMGRSFQQVKKKHCSKKLL